MLSSLSFGQPILLRDSVVTLTMIALNPSRPFSLHNLFLYLCQLPTLSFHFSCLLLICNMAKNKFIISQNKMAFLLCFLLEIPPLSRKFNLYYLYFLLNFIFFNWSSILKTRSSNVMLWNVPCICLFSSVAICLVQVQFHAHIVVIDLSFFLWD